MTKRTRSLLILVVKLLVAGGLLALVASSEQLRNLDPAKLTDHLRNWPCLLGAFALICLVPFIGAVRWRILLQCQGFELSFLRTLHLGLLGTFFNCVGLGYVGGDMVKGYYLARSKPKQDKARAVYTVLFDRAIGLFALLLLGSVVMTSNLVEVWSETPVRIASNVMTGGLIVISAWFYFQKPEVDVEGAAGQGLWRRLLHAVRIYRTKYAVLAAATALSVVAHVAVMLALFMIGQFLGMPPIGLYRFVFYAVVGLTVSAVGPLMGVGVGQYAFAGLLEREWPGSGYALGTLLATIYQLTVLSCNLLLGLPAYLTIGRDVAEVRAEIRAEEAAAEAVPTDGPSG
jgi:glycosyltransferase 2 family protein